MVVDTPIWITVAGSLGAGAFVGSFVSHLLTSRLQRRTWILDNKKAEWRGLIEEVHLCRDLMARAFVWRSPMQDFPPEERKRVTQGLVRGSRIINNSIFHRRCADEE